MEETTSEDRSPEQDASAGQSIVTPEVADGTPSAISPAPPPVAEPVTPADLISAAAEEDNAVDGGDDEKKVEAKTEGT